MEQDTIDVAAVPDDEQLDHDKGDGANAMDGGRDDDLADLYADPGVVIEEALG